MSRLFHAAFAASLVLAPVTAQHSSLTVLHGIQNLPADVEVFANGGKLFSFGYGEQRGPFDLRPGAYTFEVKLNGNVVLSANPTLQAGVNYSAIAHRTVGAGITLSLFVNDTTPIKAGESRLTVRHTADAPTVDVGVTRNNQPFAKFTNLSNPNEVKADVPSNVYAATIFPAGTSQVVFGPAQLDLQPRIAYIVYAVGNLADKSFTLLVQTIDQNLPTLSLSLSGTGCGGAIGASTLTPSFDTPFTVSLTGATANGTAWMLAGIQRQNLDLGSIGAPGCTLYNQAAVIIPMMVNGSGNASVQVTVPSALANILPTTYWQWAFTTGANSLGWQLTRSADLMAKR